MLGRLGMGVDKCIAEYNTLMEHVFQVKKSHSRLDWRGRTKSQFDSKRLRNAIEEVIQRNGALTNDLLDDGKLRDCRT